MLFDAEMLIEKRMLETVERKRTQVWGRRAAGMRLHKMGRVFEGCSWRLLVAAGFYAFQWPTQPLSTVWSKAEGLFDAMDGRVMMGQ